MEHCRARGFCGAHQQSKNTEGGIRIKQVDMGIPEK
jgi:hypothetical protein